jgi:hypothetical protein
LWVNLARNRRYELFVQEKDITVFLDRARIEGLSFLTTALPSLGKALDSYHATSVWSPITTYFKVGDDGMPVFLRYAFLGALDGNPEAVDCVRQLSYFFYKLEVSYDQETVDQFLTTFKRVDSELASVNLESSTPVIDRASRIIKRILCNTDPFDIRPCHGSGSTACRTANYEKWHKLRFYSELDAAFSYPDYFFYSLSHLSDDLEKLLESVELNPKARLVLVPKDSRGPRIISCEPAELMFIQQGIMRKMYKTIETHETTRGQINFSDQSINRDLACFASKTGEYATLDLSDASDRVSLALVERLFSPTWVKALKACRSKSTVLPNGEIVEFNKFAPMGSACCFPVEALVFWAIASAAINSSDPSGSVFVYGDDIIVEADKAETVIKGLESVGLSVNRQKSFINGPFRESCGGAYYRGCDVTPVQVRHGLNASNTSMSTDVDLCNNLIAKFGYQDALSMISVIESCYPNPFPRSEIQLPCCILHEKTSSNDVFFQRRWNNHLQRVEHRILQPYTRALARCEAAWSELLRKELTRESREHTDPDAYGNLKLKSFESSLPPGVYADIHSAQLEWHWTWLG